ncbi:MFS transporter [Pseudohalioglobus sediminis]|uniref:MFS transporter n=1 Tax=Pseudohalioglobus sediminis TaxID=2606449 RepID=A0A5B0X1R7_9GAMM|nr:MFS transporter [Pseudohalioglobus sediminis]KAA1193280.1 MFS transporter [Pseudohalioglobus sediminis]
MYYGWRIVGSAFTAQLFVIGFFTYAVSLLVEPVRTEFGVSLEQVMYSLTAATFLGLFLQPLGGVLIDRYSMRVLMSAGALLYAAGLYAISASTSIWQYIAFFALTMALANTLTGAMSASAVISRWFTASRGRALGIAAIGTSVGGVVIPALISHWLDSHSWRGALENLSLLVLVVMLPVVILGIRSAPADVGLQAELDPHAATGAADQDMGMGAILRIPAFWYIGLSLGLLFSAYTSVLSNLTPYAIDLGSSKEQASTLIMAVAITGFIGKILFGLAADKLSLRSALWLAQALVAGAFLLLAQASSHPLMLLGASILGLAAGGMLPVWGALMAQVFGLLSYGRAMGLMGPLITLCVMPGFTIIGRLYDNLGSYTPGLYLFTGFCVAAALMILPLRLDHARRS